MFRSEIRQSTLDRLLEKATNRNYGRYLPKLILKHVRGFINQPVTFDFPVTGLIGPNGGGKTTILGAAGCAYKDVPPRRFFAKSGLYDETMQNWEIEYEIVDRHTSPRDVARRTANFKNFRWKREAMPRKVLIFGVSRTVPANEKSEFLKCASSRFSVGADQIEDLPPAVATAIGTILGKDVSGCKRLKVDTSGRITFLTGRTASGRSYSEFHFGAGESSIIRMVAEIEQAEAQSLVLIEEIENGLHPLATIRMVEYLIDVADRKSIQTIFTTHSNDAIMPLPTKAIWVAMQDRIFQGKLDIQSLRAITGQIRACLVVFVEDAFAKTWVEAILRHSVSVVLEHVQVHAMEGDGAAVKVNYYHNRNPSVAIPSVCLIDGDSRQTESVTDRVYGLPGQSPELHVLGEVMDAWASYGGKLAVALLQRYEHADRVRETIENIRLTNRDPHVIFSQIGERLGLIPETTVIAAFANIWAQAHEQGCAAIAEPIRQLLSGDAQPNQSSQDRGI